MRKRRGWFGLVAGLGLLAATGFSPAVARPPGYGGTLTLHVEDAVGAPGGRVAVVLRAYASRPIGQGQVCFSALPSETDPDPGTDLLEYDGSVVFSSAGDVQVEFVEVPGNPTRFVLRFNSPSATVNDFHGPMAAVFFDLAERAVPGSRFEVAIDAEDTVLYDENGYPIEFGLEPGELSVRSAADPYPIGAVAGEFARGDVAEIGVRTAEPVAVGSGRVGIRYDPALLPGAPYVRMDPRYGRANFRYDTPSPGLVIVEFDSPDGSLNGVPGALIQVEIESATAARPKASTRVWLDPTLTWLADVEGRLLPVGLEDAAVVPRPPSARKSY